MSNCIASFPFGDIFIIDMKPNRIDKNRIEWIGGASMRYYDFEETGMTPTEEHNEWDYWFRYKGKVHNVEVKYCRGYFNGDSKYYPSKNRKWSGFDVVPTGRTWMLNAVESDGVTEGKWHRVKRGGVCLQYVFKDGWVMFSPEALGRAYLGEAWYRTSARQEFEKGKRAQVSDQLKAVINLEEGDFIPCEPPEELFVSRLHEGFNKENR